MISPNEVAIIHKDKLIYPLEPPFSPPNPVYQAVEELFFRSGNPLGEIIKRGDHVVIKPNFVTSRHQEENLSGERLLAVSTHPSVLRPIIDYVALATGPEGKISVVDSPIAGGFFERTVKLLGMTDLIDYLKEEKKINISLVDLRDFKMVPRMLLDDLRIFGLSLNLGLLVKESLPGDPLGYTTVDLGEESFFAELADRSENLRFHHDRPKGPVAHHSRGVNEYSIANTVLDADVFINVPKLKTHKKAGVTLSLKSVIGTTNQKYWLPHYQAGAPPDGDEYPTDPGLMAKLVQRLAPLPLPFGHALIVRVVRKKRPARIFDGSWEGNDTIWRTILDLNRILFYADKEGRIQTKKQRKYLTIIDGIIAGEGEGPLSPTPKKCGLLIGGTDPVAVDAVATRVMGIEVERIKQIKSADLKKINIVPEAAKDLRFKFKLPEVWR